MLDTSLKKQTMNLKPIEKIHLIEMLLNSLDKPDAEVEKMWVKESEARYEAYKKGEMKARSVEEVIGASA